MKYGVVEEGKLFFLEIDIYLKSPKKTSLAVREILSNIPKKRAICWVNPVLLRILEFIVVIVSLNFLILYVVAG